MSIKTENLELKRDLIDLGVLIKRIRRSKGWSQDKLSSESGVTKAQISLIENAKTTTRFTTLSKLFNALGVPVAEAYQMI